MADQLNVAMRVLTLVFLLTIAGERPAAAYADPGSGALLWQILMGAAVGCMFYFRRIFSWFGRKKGTDK